MENKKTSPQNKIQSAFLECIISLIIYLPLAVAFGSLTSDSTHYKPCTTSSSTYTWSFITHIFFILASILSGVIMPIFTIILTKCCNKSLSMLSFCAYFLYLIRVGIGIMSLVCFAGLCHSYGKKEGCGQLNDLVLAYIIIVSVGFGMVCFITICSAACWGGTLLMKFGMSKKCENIDGMDKQLENMSKNYEQEILATEAKNMVIKQDNEARRPFGEENMENKA